MPDTQQREPGLPVTMEGVERIFLQARAAAILGLSADTCTLEEARPPKESVLPQLDQIRFDLILEWLSRGHGGEALQSTALSIQREREWFRR